MSDAEVYQKLAGTWSVNSNVPGLQVTTTFGPDGGFVATETGFTDGMILKMEGKWLVKNGRFTETITNHSPTNIQVGSRSCGRILRLNDREVVLQSDDIPNFKFVFQKVVP